MGYAALMLTDTSNFRFQHLHTGQDTPDKVDFDKLARVVDGMTYVVLDLAGEGSPTNQTRCACRTGRSNTK